MPDPSDKEEIPRTRIKLFNKILSCLFRKKSPNIKQLTKVNVDTTSQNKFISNFDSFTGKTVEDIIVPRSDIIAVNSDISLEKLSKIVIKHSHTRTLVYDDNLDNIIGFTHIKDLFAVIAKPKKYNLKKLIRKHIISPHSMKLVDLLKQMQTHRTHIAVIVDEYGGTDGIVTIEDIIEEIVGRIDDEHDQIETESYKILNPGVIISSARVEIEELENILSTKLKEEDDEFDTIGGLIMAKTGNVPEKGAIIDISDNIKIEILQSTPRTIRKLKIICNNK